MTAAAISLNPRQAVKAYDPLARTIGGVILCLLGFFGKEMWGDHTTVIQSAQAISISKIQREEDRVTDQRWKDQVTQQLQSIQILLMQQAAARNTK